MTLPDSAKGSQTKTQFADQDIVQTLVGTNFSSSGKMGSQAARFLPLTAYQGGVAVLLAVRLTVVLLFALPPAVESFIRLGQSAA